MHDSCSDSRQQAAEGPALELEAAATEYQQREFRGAQIGALPVRAGCRRLVAAVAVEPHLPVHALRVARESVVDPTGSIAAVAPALLAREHLAPEVAPAFQLAAFGDEPEEAAADTGEKRKGEQGGHHAVGAMNGEC